MCNQKNKNTLNDFEVYTVADMGFSGLKNGKLLSNAEQAGFGILLTIDKSIDKQQNISNHSIKKWF